ncbi:MAG: leucine--tRNA ligase, partial [Bacteroidales bacterium]|nr:leucine--tRNA ligase [Bacteroidales bacterium]
MDYNFQDIEKKWQKYWSDNKTFKTDNDPEKPKYYVLDMFPYPSGAGLHVGHPLGYIASDIYARYKKLKGFNVLHPMGYDAYGLPAEQYAIKTGTHPEITTQKNIARYREQLDQIGFAYDWDREVKTSDPKYYKWTQWTFIQLFNHWYDKASGKAQNISILVAHFENHGNTNLKASCDDHAAFTAAEWRDMTEKQQQEMLMNYRLAYLADAMVNWCPELGTVLANDEVSEGFSVRGGHPVVRKEMRQWSLRITAYAERLLDGLDRVDWFDSVKDIQRNWIGRSEGASVIFEVEDLTETIEVFTTRPDTLYGATFMVLAPEHELALKLTTPQNRGPVREYIERSKNRSERERMAEVKKVTGVFTGSFAINPLNGERMKIYIADYVLAGYGTGAIMAVPAHDSRDFAFAKHFLLPIIQVVQKKDEPMTDPREWEESYDAKDGEMVNSGIITGMEVIPAITKIIDFLEEKGIGKRQINFRLRDAAFSRQRYWGEPFPVYYKNDIPYVFDEKDLPLELPPVDKYLPTEAGEPPLARAKNWHTKEGYPIETNTMPGFAGSSGYYFRYMDPHNDEAYFSKEANNYWKSVDLYFGGDEHATGHLIYARFWNKFLYDLGLACEDEPFKKMINQGKIQGRSSIMYRIKNKNSFVSSGLKKDYDAGDISPIHVDISMVDEHDVLDIEAYKNSHPENANAEFILEDGKYICGFEIEKMSKSLYNVENPDEVIEKYGADTFRLYEMFLGPLKNHKPWDTKGIEGVFRFIRKLWRLFHDENNVFQISEEEPTQAELKVIHRTIKMVKDDIERFSFNTGVSNFMICVNELQELKCNKRAILEDLVKIISPYAPHIAEELWHLLGHRQSVSRAAYPEFNEEYLIENTFEYPVSFNGKMRFKITLPL